ncbi:MAG: hypothetical protein DME01_05630 [Candidatus Rokuibacteriota bacterium]|nr:MAG: hypothetical protein DME01_05630 [Candidatus Rokubacteria bacterium]
MTQASAGWTGWLEATAAATAMRQSLWLYPIVEILHIIGFVVLVGSAAMFDLRLLGFSRQLPVTGMERHLLPWARASVLLIVPTGGLMFVAHATEFAGNPAFRMKLLFLVLAALNASLFHLRPFRRVAGWDHGARAPLAARVAAGLSLTLWTGVIACGRLLAYF